MARIAKIAYICMLCSISVMTDSASAQVRKLKGGEIKVVLLGHRMQVSGSMFGGFSGVLYWYAVNRFRILSGYYISGTGNRTLVSGIDGTWSIKGDSYCRNIVYGDKADERCLSIYNVGPSKYQFRYGIIVVSTGLLQ